ncbi:hypothetical protein NDU88_000359 [Pleurodeles waltl]|uniref:3CxxC-type domain-containing protein n=1 Tax=Pleurodeles waltl TaxID=8319 RepID=A0AAV7LCT9_PLEWA|nr:hypothetical protein NDU88_000359 [Pleurodeles waltl]
MAGDPTRSSVWVKAFSEQVRELQKEEPWTLEVVRDLGAEEGWETYKQASAFARFDCSKCGRKWPSNQVFILFCMRLGTRGLNAIRVQRADVHPFSHPDAPNVSPAIRLMCKKGKKKNLKDHRGHPFAID